MFDTNEILLNPDNDRYTFEPIKFLEIKNCLDRQRAAFWIPAEVRFRTDADDYNKLSVGEQHFIKTLLAYFAASDRIVQINIEELLLKYIKVPEVLAVYRWQMMMEDIHSEVYSKMLIGIIKDEKELKTLFNAITEIPCIKDMADWSLKWASMERTIGLSLIVNAIIEGIFFCGAFAAIWWLKKFRGENNKFFVGLVESNDFIARDESMHYNFSCFLYKNYVVNKVDEKIVHNMVDEAVNLSVNFTNNALKCDGLWGMSSALMNEYIKYMADRLLELLGHNKLYNMKNPFPWIDNMSMVRRENFFETNANEYQNADHNDNEITDDLDELLHSRDFYS